MPTDTVAVILSAYNGRHSFGEMRLGTLTIMERCLRAGRILALWWLLALIAVGVPFAHWVLVPGIAIAGVFAAVVAFDRVNIVASGSALCPNCSATISLRRGSDPKSFTQTCPGCRVHLDVAAVPPED